MRLRIAQKQIIANDIYAFALEPADATEKLPPVEAGSHITLRTPSGHWRSYSLYDSQAIENKWHIAVRLSRLGRGGSQDLCDNTSVGSEIEAQTPRNNFKLNPFAPSYLFIAGGIGITPIFAMIQSLINQGQHNLQLLYCTRDQPSTAFYKELRALSQVVQIDIHHDEGDPLKNIDLWPFLENPSQAFMYCCGPNGLMEAVQDASGHWPSEQIHFESFQGPAPDTVQDVPFKVLVKQTNETIEVASDQTLIAALRLHGYRVQSSCETGSCGSCRTKLVSGTPLHRDIVLSQAEHSAYIMPCVSRASSEDLLILDL